MFGWLFGKRKAQMDALKKDALDAIKSGRDTVETAASEAVETVADAGKQVEEAVTTTVDTVSEMVAPSEPEPVETATSALEPVEVEAPSAVGDMSGVELQAAVEPDPVPSGPGTVDTPNLPELDTAPVSKVKLGSDRSAEIPAKDVIAPAAAEEVPDVSPGPVTIVAAAEALAPAIAAGAAAASVAASTSASAAGSTLPAPRGAPTVWHGGDDLNYVDVGDAILPQMPRRPTGTGTPVFAQRSGKTGMFPVQRWVCDPAIGSGALQP